MIIFKWMRKTGLTWTHALHMDALSNGRAFDAAAGRRLPPSQKLASKMQASLSPCTLRRFGRRVSNPLHSPLRAAMPANNIFRRPRAKGRKARECRAYKLTNDPVARVILFFLNYSAAEAASSDKLVVTCK